jgi:hypothetical protein
MIINDRKKFVFIHIPKCAGTSVRAHLSRFDTTGGVFSVTNGHHPGVGWIDMAHIPLATLKTHFPDVFDKVRTYESFAIVRDPFRRFSSSLFQRLKMYGQDKVSSLSVRELETATESAMEFLDQHRGDSLLPHDYIHFQPQYSYLVSDGERIVRNIYDIVDLAAFYSAVGRQMGAVIGDAESLATQRIGVARFHRSPLTRALDSLLTPDIRKMLTPVLPEALKKTIKGVLYQDKDTRFRKIVESQGVVDFIERFYADDIALYDAVRGTGIPVAREMPGDTEHVER